MRQFINDIGQQDDSAAVSRTNDADGVGRANDGENRVCAWVAVATDAGVNHFALDGLLLYCA